MPAGKCVKRRNNCKYQRIRRSEMQLCCRFLWTFTAFVLSIFLMSCDSVNPNSGRVLTAINVTPTSADASQFPNGQVTFTATGQFSLPPLTGPVTFTAPYSGQFTVANP